LSLTKKPPNRAAGTEDRRTRRARLLMMLGLAAVAVGVYLPSCRYGFLYDEEVILLRTVPPRSIGELLERSWTPHFPGLEYFRPVPHATYLAQYARSQNEPGAFHLFNALLMGVTALIGFALLRLPCFRIDVIPAALAAGLFAVHPASSSSVIPIVGRETLIAACLSLASVYGFLRGGRKWYVISMALLALALLSKEQAVCIPIIFVLADVLGLSQDAPRRNFGSWLKRYVAPASLLTAYLVVRWSVFSGSEFRLQLIENPWGPVQSLGHMVQTICTPFLDLAYEPAVSVWLSFPRLAVAIPMLSAIIVAAAARSPLRKSVIFWCGWGLVSIAPTANVVEQQAPFSERYVLLALFAALAVLASVVSAAQRATARRWSTALGIVVIAIAAAATIHRGACFESELTFARQWAKTSPQSGEAQSSLGVELHHAGLTAEAANCFRIGMNCEPAARPLCEQWLGKMLLIQGNFAEAHEHFQWLIDQDPRVPWHYFLNGVALRGLNENARAADEFVRAIEIYPEYAAAHFLLADTYALMGDTTRFQQHLAMSSFLPNMDLSFADVRDPQLKELQGFSNLRYLILESTRVTDDGLRDIGSIATLERLWVPGTSISDRGIDHLRHHPQLYSLVLTNTSVTDAAVKDLVTIRSLRHLDVTNTEISAAGLQQLKARLPDCLIRH